MMQQHPLSAKFPALSDEQYQFLKDSIESIGIQNPITIYEGMVIDGWHRYRAATELMMACPSVELDADVDPRDFVLAQNKARRHITAAQLAMATTAVYQWHPGGAPGAPLPSQTKTVSEMAETAGVSERTIQQAKAVQTEAVEEVQQAVKEGAIGLRKAAEIAKLPKEEQAAAIDKPLPKKHEEPEPEYAGADEDEISNLVQEMQEELEQLRKIVEADDRLKAANEEITRLKAVERVLQSRINGLMAEKDAAIKQAKTYQRQVDRLKKEQAHV